MVDEIITPLGTFREVAARGELEDRWIFQCPGCALWGYMDDDQWHGRASTDHTDSSVATGKPCTYHETHDYFAVLKAHIGHEP